MLYSPEYHHRALHISRIKARLSIAFGLFSLCFVGSTYAFGVITLVLIAIGGISLWCAREYFRLQARRDAYDLKLISEFSDYEAAFLSASSKPSDEPMMIICSWDEIQAGSSLVRLVMMKRADDDFVLVGLGIDGSSSSAKLVVNAVQLEVDTAIRLFSVSQKDKARILKAKLASKDSTSGAGADGGVSDSGGCSDGGGCGGGGGGGD